MMETQVEKGSETLLEEEILEYRQSHWCCEIPYFLFVLMVLLPLAI